MKKRAAIWVSAILYIVIGIIAITLILNAGLPLINRMKERNIVTQTKQVFQALDQKIMFVANQGPGALEPFYLEIKDGEMLIDENQEKIYWEMKTIDKSQEPGVAIREGRVISNLTQTIVKDEYIIQLILDYNKSLDLTLDSEFGNVIKGINQLSIRHKGVQNNLPIIALEVR